MPAEKTFALTAEEYMDPLKMYAKAAQSKWGGSLPASNNDATNSSGSGSPEKGLLGMSRGTTVKIAVGVVCEFYLSISLSIASLTSLEAEGQDASSLNSV